MHRAPLTVRLAAEAVCFLAALGTVVSKDSPREAADVGAPIVSGKLGIADALKLALVNNRDLQTVIQERERARGRVFEAYAEALPKVALQGNYERVGDLPGILLDLDDPASRVSFGFLDSYAVDLNVTQPLFKGGQVGAALRASRLYRTLADEQVRLAAQETAYTTSLAYYRVLLVREQLRVAENYLRLSEVQRKDTETKRKFGVASDFNLLRADVDVSNASATVVRYRNLLSRATYDLLRIMGVSQNSDVELTELLEYRPASVDEEGAGRQASANRPDIASADLEVGLQKEAVTFARSWYWPRIDLYATGTVAKADPVISNLNDWGDLWRAGVTLRFDVFDGFARKGRLIQEKAALRQLEIQRLETGERAQFEVREAALSIQDAAEAVEVQRKTVEQASEGLRLAEVGYREGTLEQVEILDARASLTQAQFLYYEAIHAHVISLLALERAKGTLGPALEAVPGVGPLPGPPAADR